MKTKMMVAPVVLAGMIAMIACGKSATPGDSVRAAATAPSSGNTASANSASAAPAPAVGGPVKTVEMRDPVLNLVYATLEIPANWNFEGTMLYMPGCTVPMVTMAYRAYSPDMLYGVQMIPASYFYWAEDQRAIPKGRDCKALQPISAANYGALVSIAMRPGAEVDSVETAPSEPALQAMLVKGDQRAAEYARSYGNPNTIKTNGEVKLVHIHYDLNGHPEEETLQVTMTVADMPVSVPVNRPGEIIRIAMKSQLTSTASVMGVRAPKGKLQDYMPVYTAIAKSWKTNADTQAKSTQYVQNLVNRQIAASWQSFHSMMQQSDAQFQQMHQNAEQFIANMQKQGDARNAQFNADMDRKSAHAKDVSDYLLDQQYFVNPTTGQTQTQSNQYSHTYTNGSGPGSTVVQTNSANAPAQGNWTELQPIKH